MSCINFQYNTSLSALKIYFAYISSFWVLSKYPFEIHDIRDRTCAQYWDFKSIVRYLIFLNGKIVQFYGNRMKMNVLPSCTKIEKEIDLNNFLALEKIAQKTNECKKTFTGISNISCNSLLTLINIKTFCTLHINSQTTNNSKKWILHKMFLYKISSTQRYYCINSIIEKSIINCS